jgi:ATP-dependent Clp protease ATP-binding subunit ClpB
MNLNNFTIKAQEAIQKASEIAGGNQQQAIETAHILKGLLSVDENVISYLLKKLNVNINRISEVLDAQIQSFPKVSGSDIYLSSGANSALQKAATYLKEFKDEFVSVEHVLLGLLEAGDKVSSILKDAGVNQKDLKKAILELRGNTRVTDQNAEATYNALNKYARNLNEYAESGKLDPVIGRDEEIRRVIQILSRRTKK